MSVALVLSGGGSKGDFQLAPACGTRNDIFRSVLKGQANRIAILLASYGRILMTGSRRTFRRGASITPCVGLITGSRFSKSWRKSYTKIQRC
jgi:hypothetical protein